MPVRDAMRLTCVRCQGAMTRVAPFSMARDSSGTEDLVEEEEEEVEEKEEVEVEEEVLDGMVAEKENAELELAMEIEREGNLMGSTQRRVWERVVMMTCRR